MAKKTASKKKATKTSRKTATKPAKKKTARKVTTDTKKVFVTDGPLPAKQRDKALRKLRKLSVRPSHPGTNTGPAMLLGYGAPMPKTSKTKKSGPRARKKKR
jgi:hypothetical protein